MMAKKTDDDFVTMCIQSKGHYEGTMAVLPELKAELLINLLEKVLTFPTVYFEEQKFSIEYSSEFRHANDKIKYDYTIITATYKEKVSVNIYEKYIKNNKEWEIYDVKGVPQNSNN